jgi:hypothetical protein
MSQRKFVDASGIVDQYYIAIAIALVLRKLDGLAVNAQRCEVVDGCGQGIFYLGFCSCNSLRCVSNYFDDFRAVFRD